jgi:hypothetical protein
LAVQGTAVITKIKHAAKSIAWFTVFLVACIAAHPKPFTAHSTFRSAATIASLELLARSTEDHVAGIAESDHSACSTVKVKVFSAVATASRILALVTNHLPARSIM